MSVYDLFHKDEPSEIIHYVSVIRNLHTKIHLFYEQRITHKKIFLRAPEMLALLDDSVHWPVELVCASCKLKPWSVCFGIACVRLIKYLQLKSYLNIYLDIPDPSFLLVPYSMYVL